MKQLQALPGKSGSSLLSDHMVMKGSVAIFRTINGAVESAAVQSILPSSAYPRSFTLRDGRGNQTVVQVTGQEMSSGEALSLKSVAL